MEATITGQTTTSRTRRRADHAPRPAGSPGHLEEAIARKAYELFLARGGQHGNDLDDWLRAEREVTGSGTETTAVRES